MTPFNLAGKIIRLEPLTLGRLDVLCRIGLDPVLWRATTIRVGSRDEMEAYIRVALEAQRAGTALPWVIICDQTNEVIGTTRYHSIVAEHLRLEIGFTWIAPPWQRTGANVEAKYLLLRHAFEVLHFNRVEFKADAENEPSRHALRGIGATPEAIVRAFKLSAHRGPRDLVLFSIVAQEWPKVRVRLEEKLDLRIVATPLPNAESAISPRLKVLFVCAMNKERSVTAERLYRNDARLEVRSAGVRSEASRRVSESDLKWADVVFVMEREHKQWIAMRFGDVALPRIDVLEIPDEFAVMDPQLQEMLTMMLDPEIEHLLANRRKPPAD